MKSKFFYGQTGSGKTLGAMKEVVRDFFLGRSIYSNMQGIKKIPYYYVDLADLILMVQSEEIDLVDSRPKTLMLDEIHTMFDGRRSSSRENIDFSIFISQCRKRHFNVYYTSQWLVGADVRIRTLTNSLVKCIPHFSRNDVGYGTVDEPEPIAIEHTITDVIDLMENVTNPKKQKKVFPRWRNRPFYQFYDTYEVIRPVEAYGS
jgi:hypothetical protein